jgi:hypothetical protein
MTKRLLTMLCLVSLVATACGPNRGLRAEQADAPADQVGAGSSFGAVRVLSATPTSGTPVSLATDGSTIWVSAVDVSTVFVQAVTAGTGRAGGTLGLAERSYAALAITTTPSTLWMLARPQGQTRLFHVPTDQGSARAITRSARFGTRLDELRGQGVALPAATRLAGATRSAVWLISQSAGTYILWRVDVATSKRTGFPLSSHGWPGVAVTPQQVYVALRTGRPNTVAIQTRDPDGAILGQSEPLRLTGAFQSRPLAGCHGSIFGWTRSESGAALFRVDAAGHALTYSHRLPPRERDHPSKLTAIAFDKNCRSVWVATVNRAAGVVSRLRASSLELTGQLETPYVGTLVWTHMSLWASDLVHHAILRIR